MRRVLLGGLCAAAAISVAAGLVGLAQRGVLDASLPAAASVALQPPPAVPPVAPTFDIVKVAPDGSAVVAGRAEPGANVTVFDGGRALGAVVADQRGEWVLVPNSPLPPGTRELRAEAVDRRGRTVPSQQAVALSIAPPSAAGARQDTASVPRRPGATPLTTNLSIDSVDIGGKGGFAASGHAAPGSTVELYIGNRPIAAATADASGRWAAVAAQAPPDPAELRLDEIAPGGGVARRIAVPLMQRVATGAPAGDAYVVQPGNNLWQIARRSYGSGLRYVIIYSANSGKIRDPDLIYPGQLFRLPKS